jgi:O-antigen/teichoic acid export membrane protein
MRFSLSDRLPLPPVGMRLVFMRITLLLCGAFASAILAFATQLVLTRGMSVTDYGTVVAMLAAVNVVTPLAVLGMGWFWLELFGREGWRATRWIAQSARLGALASLISIVLLVTYVAWSTEPHSGPKPLIVLLLIPVLLGQSLAETTSARLQLEERFVALAGWQMLTQLGRALIALGLLATGSVGIESVLAGYSIVSFVIITVSLLSLRQVWHGRIALSGHDVEPPDRTPGPAPSLMEVLRQAAPYCLVPLFYLIYTQGVVAIVHVMLGPEAAAIYNVAFLITTAVYLLPHVIYVKYLAGRLFRWWSHDRTMFASVFHLGLAAHLAIGLLAACVIIAGSPIIIPAVFDMRYADAVPVLCLLAVAIPVRFVQHAYGSALFANEHIWRKIVYMGGAAAASVLLNFALIPALAMTGAAISAVLAEFLLLSLYIYGVRRHVRGIDVSATFRLSTLRSALAHVARSRESPFAAGGNR